MAGGNAEGGAGTADCSPSRAVPPRDHVIVCDAVGKGWVGALRPPTLFTCTLPSARNGPHLTPVSRSLLAESCLRGLSSTTPRWQDEP
jgi:hypothetical protein